MLFAVLFLKSDDSTEQLVCNKGHLINLLGEKEFSYEATKPLYTVSLYESLEFSSKKQIYRVFITRVL